METVSRHHLPPGLLRAILTEPAQQQVAGYHPTSVFPCHHEQTPMVVIVVPGIAESGDLRILTPLSTALRDSLPNSVVQHVAIGPAPWPFDEDIPTYAERLHDFVLSIRCRYRAARLVFVTYSLSGPALLYCLSQWPSLTTDGHPLIITLASPVVGSDRYRRALNRWRLSVAQDGMGPAATLVAQLEPSSAVMIAVRAALAQHDVHLLLSRNDQIVDRCSACPSGYRRAIEVDTGFASPLKRHFAFPQHPVVIDTVTQLLRAHAATLAGRLWREDAEHSVSSYNARASATMCPVLS